MNHAELFIARRYLISKNKIRFINVIGLISIIGITIGVAALFIALSVFNGFNGVVTDVLVGFDPHIRIEKKGTITSDEILLIEKTLRQNQNIISASPFVSGKAMLVARSFNRVVYVRGVDEQGIGNVSGLRDKMVLGDLALNDSGGTESIIIGYTLADRLGSVVGDEIAIISPYEFQSALTGLEMPSAANYRITGIYESNNRDYDANYAYISIGAAQRLFNLGNTFNGIEMRLDDFDRAESVKEWLESNLPPAISVLTWYDLHRNLYSVMKIERWSAYIFLCLIIVVATFNMLGSLSMGVVEKRREIGVLKSMGMNSKNIIRIFMFEGMLIGFVGTAAGMLIGFIVLFLQIQYQLFPLDTSVYIIPAIPVKILWTDFISIVIASMGLSFVAAYYPAKRASALLPAEAIRWE